MFTIITNKIKLMNPLLTKTPYRSHRAKKDNHIGRKEEKK